MSIAHVQSANNATGSGASLSVTVSALTTGNVIVLAGMVTNEALTLTPSASGVTFTAVPNVPVTHSGAPTIRGYMWVGVVDTGGATSVTITPSSGTPLMNAWVVEFSGVATSSNVDQSANNESSASGTSHNIAIAVTTTQANEVLVSATFCNGSSGALTAGTDYNLVHSMTTRLAIGQWRIVSATGSYDCQITTATSRSSVTIFATLKEAASGAARRRRLICGGLAI